MTRILVVGETILDLAPVDGGARYEPVLGGSAFNTARAMGALGADVAFAGAVSRDAWGARFRDALAACNIDCARLRDSGRPMPLALVSPEGACGPGFALYLECTAHADALAPADLPETAAHLHVSSFHACVPPTGASVLALMKQTRGRATISFDPNVRPGVLPARTESLELIEERAGLSDIVKASAQDIEWLFPGRDPLDAMTAWARERERDEAIRRPRLAILTRGADGATAFCGDARVTVRAPAVEVVDSVGAGDVFTAAVLAEMDRDGALGPQPRAIGEDDLRRWLAFAAAAASWTCGRRGAQAPRRSDFAALAAP